MRGRDKNLILCCFYEKISYFCDMKNLVTTIYTRADDLPEMECRNFFHSKMLFALLEQTPRQQPYMAVVADSSGRILGHLLAVVRYRLSALSLPLCAHCRILGEGEYIAEDSGFTVTGLFGELLDALTSRLSSSVLYIEISNLSGKMLGYKQLRDAGYFPVHWMSIHNSLHSRAPEERISRKMAKRIERSYRKGVVTAEVDGEQELEAFCSLLRWHNRFKVKRYIPDCAFFRGLMQTGCGRLFVTRYKGRVVGCCACVYSEGNAYLWYFAFLRKSFSMVHPDVMTVWHAVKYAHSHGYAHIHFMDVGLPFSKNPFREFILRFGGKPVSTYRWFRFSARWLNSIVSWIYRR